MNQIDGLDSYHIYCAWMKLHQLSALVAIADSGSFTSAGKQLRISQSSLSHAVTGLEQELGVSLLDRGRQGAKATDAGGRVLTHARQVLACLDSIRAEADNTSALVKGRVRVGSIPSATVAFLPRVIGRFTRQHPKVEVILLEEPSQEQQQLNEWLQTNTIDVALIQLPLAGSNVVLLMQDELRAIVSTRSALAERKRVSLRELAKQPFVMSRYSSESLIYAAYAKLRLSLVPRFAVQDLGTLVSMVREGLGISIVPRLAFSEIPEGVSLVPVLPRIRRELGLVLKSPEHSPPAVWAFVRQAQELVRRGPKK
jgi:DNA-binding transcriptional LysR family regulator